MFIDEAKIQVKAGDGGHGCLSFRREKFIPKGGPDGGDGGAGGSVYFQAVQNLDTLMDFTGKHHWRAQNGRPGSGKNKHGANGEDLIITVPPGTLIYDADLALLLKDLNKAGLKVRICRGGKGGKGNKAFATPTNQAPRTTTPGKKGQERNIRLELKLIADVGLVGMPNAGKSTLISRCSAARPKIADYPFTTTEPVLGIVELSDFRRFVMADIPGLIEGAHNGAGLGFEFLRHIERTRIIVHIVDIMPTVGCDPVENYKAIRHRPRPGWKNSGSFEKKAEQKDSPNLSSYRARNKRIERITLANGQRNKSFSGTINHEHNRSRYRQYKYHTRTVLKRRRRVRQIGPRPVPGKID
jgi:GTP-binding protein